MICKIESSQVLSKWMAKNSNGIAGIGLKAMVVVGKQRVSLVMHPEKGAPEAELYEKFIVS